MGVLVTEEYPGTDMHREIVLQGQRHTALCSCGETARAKAEEP